MLSSAGVAALSSPSSSSQRPFSLQNSQLYYTCQHCLKQQPLDADAPIHESSILAFNAVFQQQQQQQQQAALAGKPALTPAELLSESFVVLPASKLASQFAPPAAAATNSSFAARLIGAVSGNSKTDAAAASSAAASAAAAPKSSTEWEKQISIASKVMEIASAQCGVAQPLCTHCSHTIFDELDKKYAECERDKEEYQRYLKQMQSSTHTDAAGAGGADASQLTAEELAEDEELSRQEAQLEEQMAAIRREKQALNMGL